MTISSYPDHIFVSEKPSTSKIPYRFEDHDELQKKLTDICNNWNDYLKLYFENSQLLFENKMPWEQNERSVVSTLAASIARSSKRALITEEMPVPKPAKEVNGVEIKKTDKGRCDLWVVDLASKNNSPFCFFLEAKFAKPKHIDDIENFITSKGIGRIFRDYLKSLNGEKLTQKSPYKFQVHHYIVSMLTVPFFSENNSDKDLTKIKDALKNVFNKDDSHPIKTKGKSDKSRKLFRFPTVALIVNQAEKDLGKQSEKYNGMVTMLTVLAEGKKGSMF